MAALYACTKCHQRFPFEALSQGQQLCKVRGLGRRPGAGDAPGAARNSRSCEDARRGPLGQGVAGPLRLGNGAGPVGDCGARGGARGRIQALAAGVSRCLATAGFSSRTR